MSIVTPGLRSRHVEEITTLTVIMGVKVNLVKGDKTVSVGLPERTEENKPSYDPL